VQRGDTVADVMVGGAKVNARLPVIHVGLPKTGTKMLQRRLFHLHPEVYFLGRFDVETNSRQYNALGQCRDETVFALMQQIAFGDVRNPDFAVVQRLWGQTLATAQGRVVVWSYEGYATDTLLQRQIRARNAWRTFGDAIVLITLRHPVALLESAYLHWLRATNVGERSAWGVGPNVRSIHEWLALEWSRDVDHHLSFADTIRAYERTFGRGRVQVLLFEDLVADTGAFVADVCGRIGVDPDVGRAYVAGGRENAGWGDETIARLQRIAASPTAAWRFRFGSHAARRAALSVDLHGDPLTPSPRHRPRIDAEWRRRIVATCQAGTAWVAEAYGVPLERYGYFDPDPPGSG
jgi:hypothetical protein